ncbi:sensor histidine kinase [Winogradskyella forsetii]|uniref:sensor histidine kinase n=1 Tax=Winogradskyella forsetii TaxID=2686077 RepID=UPI0015C053BC|nr:histidine kinase [Winogradskyella forsetii]
MESNNKIKTSHTSISLYWKCQLIGWGLVSLFWLYIALFRDSFQMSHAIINYFFDVAICIAITHAYRTLAIQRKWNELGIKKLIWKVIPALLILSVVFMLLMNLKMAAYIYLVNSQSDSISKVFVWNPLFVWNPVLITGLRHMTIWLLAYHLYHYYQKEVDTTRENAQLSIIAKQAQLDNLSAQLNPHFLFNSLNSIKSLVIESPDTARRAIDLLSDLLRSSLYEKDKDLIPIKNELDLVYDYIELEKMRFEERLQLKTNIDKSLINYKIPALSIQLLVENAIKHGIDLKVDGGAVVLNLKEEDNHIHMTVENPGVINQNNKVGLGLKNLKKRLEIQYKGKASFSLTPHENNQVCATIIIPMHIDNEYI